MNKLLPNQQLAVGQQLVSTNGRVNLIMQGDGNLVLYRTMFGKPLWASNTNGRPATRAVMQTDGNFVVYSASNVPFWATATNGFPGASITLQDDGNLVVYDAAGRARWASNTVQNFQSPTFGYGDARGYTYVETSESWKELCRVLPCFDALQWPDYASKHVDDVIDGQPVVIQLWKGWCQKFLGIQSFPGGIGAEVGVYRRIPGHARPTSLPFLPPVIASRVLSLIAGFTDSQLWWPFPELGARVEFTLVNPVNNTTFFHAGTETTYWLAQWMNDGSYSRYQRDQGRRWGWLPPWWPGNSRTPFFSADYWLDYKVNGKAYPRW
jgi:hypothetical protein